MANFAVLSRLYEDDSRSLATFGYCWPNERDGTCVWDRLLFSTLSRFPIQSRIYDVAFGKDAKLHLVIAQQTTGYQ